MAMEQRTLNMHHPVAKQRAMRVLQWPLRRVYTVGRRLRVALARKLASAGVMPALSQARLKALIDWQAVGLREGDFAALGDYAATGKFERFGYWVGRDELDWYCRTDPFGSHGAAVRQADQILDGHVSLAGAEPVHLPEDFDWSADPVTGKPMWTNAGALRPRRDVDSRFWVELNLQRHFAPVALAGRITAQPRYAEYLATQWRRWLEANPPIDEEYVSDGLELSLRVVVWTHVLFLLGQAAFGQRGILQLLALVARYGAVIEQQCDSNTNRNNHLAAEAFGLFFIGTMYPELKGASRWRDKGLAVLGQVAEEQFSEDGVHVEQSLGYQCFVAEMLAAALTLARRNDDRVPAPIEARLQACTAYLTALRRPDGSLARYGDEGMPLFSATGATQVAPDRTLAILRTLVLGQTADDDARWTEEVFWFGGRADQGTPHPVSEPSSGVQVFDQAHIVLQADRTHVHFDCSRHGWGRRAGHGHDDALSFDYFHAGAEWVGDIGTYTYRRRGEYRTYFAGARGHNGVLFNGRGAGVMVPNGSFGWLQKSDAALLGAGTGDGFSWAAGRHMGSPEQAGDGFPVVDRYLVLSVDGTLLVVDWCEQCPAGTVDSLLHLTPDIVPERDGDVTWLRRGAANLQVLSQCAARQEVSSHFGADPETPGWYSRGYGRVEPAWVLRQRAACGDPFWRVCALVPKQHPARLTAELDGSRLRCSLDSDMDTQCWSLDLKAHAVVAAADR